MKQLIKASAYSLFTLFLVTLVQVFALAQDSSGVSSSSTSTKTTTTSATTDQVWYTQPWVWIVGGAILLLIIVALVRGNNSTSTGRSDSVTVKKTITRDTDTV